MGKLKVLFVGCVQLSRDLLKETFDSPHAEVVGVVTKHASAFNSDFCSLAPMAELKGIPCAVVEGNEQEPIETLIRDTKPDVVYCFGWSHLLRKKVLGATRLGVIGCHPAALPKNRGRHPLVWALALGLKQTASTFFFMDAGADSGDILSQVPIEIGDKDAGELYAAVTQIARKQVGEFTEQLQLGTFERLPQNSKDANTWRKRSPLDGAIDWRMSARCIHNLVRALAKPYVGAHLVIDGIEIKIWKTAIEKGAPENMEPGKVLSSEGREFVVKCGEDAIRVVEHECNDIPKTGAYL